MLISGYFTYERGFDRHFPERENIFRIITDIYSEGELKHSKPQNERGLGAALKENYPEVIETGFLTGTINPQYRIGEEIFRDIPQQAHFSFNMLLSFHDQMHLPPPVKDSWGKRCFTLTLN